MPDMLVKLYDLPEVEPHVKRLREKGIVIREAMPYEKHQVVEWVRSSFSQGWASQCDIAFSNHPVSCFIATEHVMTAHAGISLDRWVSPRRSAAVVSVKPYFLSVSAQWLRKDMLTPS